MAPDDTAPATPDDTEALGYAEAVAELEEILTQLDGDDIDVDHLAAQVGRAATLIALCRERLGAARVEVTRIVADLDLAAPATSDDEPSDDDADDLDDDLDGDLDGDPDDADE